MVLYLTLPLVMGILVLSLISVLATRQELQNGHNSLRYLEKQSQLTQAETKNEGKAIAMIEECVIDESAHSSRLPLPFPRPAGCPFGKYVIPPSAEGS